MLKKNLSIWLVVLLVFHGWAWAAPRSPAAEAVPIQSDAEFEASVLEMARTASELRPLIDRCQFDLEETLECLDWDAEEMARFVTEEIGLEVYQGVLRGARGTLISRAGNALDQALLLATLLKDARYETVIRQGDLSASAADDLVQSMASPRPLSPSIWKESPTSVVDAPASSSESGADRAVWVAAANAKADRLIETLAKEGIRLDASGLMDELREEARNYHWVEYRTGPSAPWVSVHPALGRDPGVEATTTFSDEIPTELTHQVVLEVLVRQRRGSKTKESPLMAPLEMASANLIDNPLTFTLAPDQFLNQKSPLDPQTMAASSRFLLPLVNGKPAGGAKALSLRGLLVPLDALGMGAAGLFETISEKGSEAIDAVSGMKKKDEEGSAVAIEGLRLRVTFRSPDGGERIEIRELFDEQRDLSPEARKAKEPGAELVKALGRSHTFIFATGSYSESVVFDSLLEQMENFDPLMEAAGKIEPGDCKTLECFSDMNLPAADPGSSLAMLFLAFDEVFGDQQGGVSYRHTPNLVRLSRSLLPEPGKTEARIDIISNARRALVVHDGRLNPAPESSLLAGVWETQIETDLLASPEATAPQPASSFPNLRPMSAAQLRSHSRTSSVARAMLRDLDDGYVVLAVGTLDLESDPGGPRWWRVDSKNGETLGMTAYGGAVTQEAINILTVILVVVASLTFTLACTSLGGESARCFMCMNLFSFSFVMALSAVSSIGSEYSWWERMEDFYGWCTSS